MPKVDKKGKSCLAGKGKSGGPGKTAGKGGKGGKGQKKKPGPNQRKTGPGSGREHPEHATLAATHPRPLALALQLMGPKGGGARWENHLPIEKAKPYSRPSHAEKSVSGLPCVIRTTR
jgi:hypothetical protein